MKVVIAPQGFKGCLSALEVATAIETGVRRAFPQAETILKPMADGGEGTVQALIDAAGGRIIHNLVTGPLGDKADAAWGVLPDNHTAVIEMAAASGINLVSKEKLNPMKTSTYGTGELIRAALSHGCRKIIVGLGGSATNDGGAGMAQALGVRLLDDNGDDLPVGGAVLSRLKKIDVSGIYSKIARTEIIAATDVTNPLCGEAGCSSVYGTQKGADAQMIRELDVALANYASVIKHDLGMDVRNVPGSGAAGGLGAGLLAFTHATIMSGVEMVMEATELVAAFGDADLVFTAEGQVDKQSAYGKVTAGVAGKAKQYGLPVIVLAGSIGPGYQSIYQAGVDSVLSIAPGPISLEESMNNAGPFITDAADRAMRLFLAGRQPST